MAVGTYGVCERCGEEIDFARLKAIPQTTLCMACRKLAEL
jgi:DnaK suppressor protein